MHLTSAPVLTRWLSKPSSKRQKSDQKLHGVRTVASMEPNIPANLLNLMVDEIELLNLNLTVLPASEPSSRYPSGN